MGSRVFRIACLSVAGSLLLAVGASAAGAPTATSGVTIKPQGKLYKEVKRPVDSTTFGTITPAPGATSLNPLMESKTYLPPDIAYVPDPNMPTCTFTAAEANVPTDTAKAMCPHAILGNGTSVLYIGQSVAAIEKDPVLTIFNGPPDHGRGVTVIQGYSANVNSGITFTGEIKNNIQDVTIPRLTYDSATPAFSLSIPGDIGQDPDFVQASCSTGSITTHADFTLGDRDAAGNVSDVSVVKSKPTTEKCHGLAGKPKFAGLKVKGPMKVKSGRKGTFKVTVKNTGTASSKKGKVTASGAGKGKATLPVIKPGVSRTVTVRAKVSGKKGKKATVKFKATGGSSASGKAKVKIG